MSAGRPFGPPDLWVFPGAGGAPASNWTETASFGPVHPGDFIAAVWHWTPPPWVEKFLNGTVASLGITCANRANLTDVRTPNAGQMAVELSKMGQGFAIPTIERGRWSCYLELQPPTRSGADNPRIVQKTQIFGFVGKPSSAPTSWQLGAIPSPAPNSNMTTAPSPQASEHNAPPPAPATTNIPAPEVVTESSGLDPKATAGIAVGSVVFGILGTYAAVRWWRRRRRTLAARARQAAIEEVHRRYPEADGYPVAADEKNLAEMDDDHTCELETVRWSEQEPVELPGSGLRNIQQQLPADRAPSPGE